MKKKKWLAMLFSIIPGAGQMYLGLMQRGITVITIFVAIIAVAILIPSPVGEIILLALPVLWLYSVFDTLNLVSLPEAQQSALRGELWLDGNSLMKKDWVRALKKRYKLIGLAVIGVGLFILLNNVMGYVSDYIWNYQPQFADLFFNIRNSLPVIVIAVIVIVIGVRILAKKPKTEEKGDKNDE